LSISLKISKTALIFFQKLREIHENFKAANFVVRLCLSHNVHVLLQIFTRLVEHDYVEIVQNGVEHVELMRSS